MSKAKAKKVVRKERTKKEQTAQSRSAETRVKAGTAGKRLEKIFGLSPYAVLRHLGAKGFRSTENGGKLGGGKIEILARTIEILSKGEVVVHPSGLGWQPEAITRIEKEGNPRKESLPDVPADVSAKIVAAAKKAVAEFESGK